MALPEPRPARSGKGAGFQSLLLVSSNREPQGKGVPDGWNHRSQLPGAQSRDKKGKAEIKNRHQGPRRFTRPPHPWPPTFNQTQELTLSQSHTQLPDLGPLPTPPPPFRMPFPCCGDSHRALGGSLRVAHLFKRSLPHARYTENSPVE